MTKSLMISMNPKYLLHILNGEKTLELRKNVPKDFKGWVYVYCTKGKPYYEPRINGITNQKMWNIHNDFIYHTDINSKVVARFWFDEYETMDTDYSMWVITPKRNKEILEQSCLTWEEADKYANYKTLYVWHIKKLEIFDTPLNLSDFYVHSKDFYTADKYGYENENLINYVRITKAPISWQYVYTKGE